MKTKRVKITSAWSLARASLADARKDWWPYLKILLVVTVPVDIVSVVPALGGDPSISTFASVAAIVMNVAVIWAIVQRRRTGSVPTVAAAYYDGSIALVRFVLVSAVLVIMLIPAGLGTLLYNSAISATGYAGSSAAELFLIGFVALLLASPSFYLITRYGLGPLIAVRDGLRPLAALRAGRAATMGRFWPVAGRYLLLAVFVLVLSVPGLVVSLVLAMAGLGVASSLVFEMASTIIVLPLTNLYLVRLYDALESTPVRADTPPA